MILVKIINLIIHHNWSISKNFRLVKDNLINEEMNIMGTHPFISLSTLMDIEQVLFSLAVSIPHASVH